MEQITANTVDVRKHKKKTSITAKVDKTKVKLKKRVIR